MSASHTHPRRRPIKASSPSSSTHGMSLRKSGTFHSPKSVASDVCGLDNQHYMPRRSSTNTESLEQLLQDSSIRRVENILKDFDRRIAGHKSSSTGSTILSDPEVLPVPSLFLTGSSLEATHMDVDPKPKVQEASHEHASDSGLGSSIDTKDGKARMRASARESISTSVSTSHAAITRSFSALGGSEEKHTLSDHASEQIRKYIVEPILAEEALKDFHPLITDVPRRIGEKNICNLRDLEKTLIFLAPVSGIRYLSQSAEAYCILRGLKELSATPASYLQFCERSIQLLHTTVDRLSEQDQRLPSDRPYTNNYFLDLVEQIRRYAAIMAATRRKEENGEELDEMDYSRDEKITLRGGLSHNGRPAELVREKNGKTIPLAEGADGVATGFSSTKRALSDDEMDMDEVTRSMARRRKSDKPGDVMHTCRDCKKEFKRPCDLTKHEKTHSRPWKCTDEKCKYFELGWPTEKERDRHINDKHSNAPAQYKCRYPPCTYASKRESNCKQHMEKAHGWEYVRSKSNGRKKSQPIGSDRSPPTPLTPFLGTPQSVALSTPMTPFMPSPSVPLIDHVDFNSYGYGTSTLNINTFQPDFRRDSVTTDESTALTYSSGHSPMEPTSFEDAVTPEDAIINHNDIYNNNCTLNINTNFSGAFQQPTPAMSTAYDFDLFPITSGGPNVPHLSPSGQGDMTLYSPPMHVDEGFGEGMETATFAPPIRDFELFGDSGSSNMPSLGGNSTFFPDMHDMNNFGGQFDTMYIEPTPTLDDLMGNYGPQQ
ncbi:hypothetical protein BU23DRAFT_632693 [Bimuria novae-zelandiae CBS 107.79]|uniref:C2H2-type domain-containing protein n=1 Tax=Bimuria novae-zelandiae CBS 107.79 TaxID=1447943 RepID=A0A6A5VF79_9PLEO|nr:hypothetical protein BU23DRAFT_632693 [Bimuria novae-zelandiae CBS 107.79]